jgi:hypothetical protein
MVADVNMLGVFSDFGCVGKVNSRLVVFEDGSRASLGEPEVGEKLSELKGFLSGFSEGNILGFHASCGNT